MYSRRCKTKTDCVWCDKHTAVARILLVLRGRWQGWDAAMNSPAATGCRHNDWRARSWFLMNSIAWGTSSASSWLDFPSASNLLKTNNKHELQRRNACYYSIVQDNRLFNDRGGLSLYLVYTWILRDWLRYVDWRCGCSTRCLECCLETTNLSYSGLEVYAGIELVEAGWQRVYERLRETVRRLRPWGLRLS